MRCPLCGYNIPREKIECRNCPMGNNCQLVCCPHCHYQFIDPHSSGVLNLLKKLFKLGIESGDPILPPGSAGSPGPAKKGNF